MMYYSPLRAGKSMSVLLQPQVLDTRSSERNSPSSSPRSTSSTRSERNWYHRTSNRSVPDLVAGRHPNRLRGITSIRELARKTSRSVLNPTLVNRQSFSVNQSELDQRHSSVTHLPGSPSGPSCRPPTLVIQDSTYSGLESLTPDQSGISNESSEPVTPAAAEAIHLIPVPGGGLLDQDMGNSESKFVDTKVGKAIRKPVSGLLKGKNSMQTLEGESSNTPTLVPERASEPTTEQAMKDATEATEEAAEQVAEQAKENVNPIGPPPVLRHRASTGQVQVPRRRSSLTAIHLDSSHFEKSSSTKHSDRDNKGNRASSFSESFQPVISSSNATNAVPSPNPQEGDDPSENFSPRLLSPPLSDGRVPSIGSSTQPSNMPKPAHIYFPVTWPNGPPELKSAALTPTNYECYRSHQMMRREKALFNQVPCMTCSVDDKRERYTCSWCELRICLDCMKQLDSISGRPLANLVEWVVRKDQLGSTGQGKESLRKGQSQEVPKQGKSVETLKIDGSAERRGSEAKSFETMKKVKSAEQPGFECKSKDAWKDTAIAEDPGEKSQGEEGLVAKAETEKKAAPVAEQPDPTEKAAPVGETNPAREACGEQETSLRGGYVKETIGSSFRLAHVKRSWGRAKADQVLRDSRG